MTEMKTWRKKWCLDLTQQCKNRHLLPFRNLLNNCDTNINQSINQISVAPISPVKPDSVAWQPHQCSTIKLMKRFRNINGPSGMLVSMGKKAKLTRCVLRRSRMCQMKWLKGQPSILHNNPQMLCHILILTARNDLLQLPVSEVSLTLAKTLSLARRILDQQVYVWYLRLSVYQTTKWRLEESVMVDNPAYPIHKKSVIHALTGLHRMEWRVSPTVYKYVHDVTAALEWAGKCQDVGIYLPTIAQLHVILC